MFGELKQKERIKQLERMREAQFLNVKDEYSAGFYNGLEFAVALFDGREPEYLSIGKEPDVVEKEQKKGRTKVSGIITRR